MSTIVISGASGLIGSALTEYLTGQGHQVYPLIRGQTNQPPFHWQPAQGQIHWDREIPVDTVINLAGAPLTGRWTTNKKQQIYNSRIASTRLLAETLAALPEKPRLLISSSGINYYGDTGNQAVDESAPPAGDYMATLARDWETATEPARAAGIRTVCLRTAMVLSTQGGGLATMLLPFKLALGGRIGSGEQYMSWVSMADVPPIVQHIMEHDDIQGPVNMAAPTAVTNRTFTRTLGRALHRPTPFPMPAKLVRLLFGEMADYLLLASIRVAPQVLQSSGYRFQHPTLEQALQGVLREKL